MNTTKSVYNRLFAEDKVELGKHEVELALIDDAKKIVLALTKQSDELGKETLSIISAKNRLSEKIDKLKQDIAPAKKVVEDYNKQLKDLGLTDTPTIVRNMVDAIAQAEKTASNFEQRFLK